MATITTFNSQANRNKTIEQKKAKWRTCVWVCVKLQVYILHSIFLFRVVHATRPSWLSRKENIAAITKLCLLNCTLSICCKSVFVYVSAFISVCLSSHLNRVMSMMVLVHSVHFFFG